ncbi:phage tail protein [Pseudomonas rubra]|uniref:Phage tail protein n=1 Tax=Pseudomonas rubra TaxID=2942627 RepID=A0ABT5PF54_9PSED|nr:phage tail protein [Pseudomonas rubra]MDD1016825.1 phage tail protein [Pseudomonas rubra]MDD1041464.1 phage tail protein [Pseudomonas rubra]MDD1154969.1 phage tail protein [Pseudomonas rubra]
MAKQQLPPALAGDERFAMLCELLDESMAEVDLDAMLVYLVDLVKPALLPVLAHQFSMLDEAAWLLAESTTARRNLIKHSVELHRYKGTPWAVREVIRLLGFGEITLQEGLNSKVHDGSIFRDGRYVHGDPSSWAVYRVFLKRPITNDQAVLLRRLLLYVAPARCRLMSLDYQAVAIRHNGEARRDGQYNHGSS